MNDLDLHKLLSNTRDSHVSLPLHQERLRARLIRQHQQTRRPFGTFITGVIAMKKNILTVGLPLALVAVFAFVGLTFLDSRPATAQEIIQGVSKATRQMTPEEIENIGKDYKQNVMTRLEEAKRDPDLKIMTDADLESWGFIKKTTEGHATTHLGYTDDEGHRIIFGINAQNEPMFVYDVDMNMQQSSGSSDSPNGGSNQPVQLQVN